MPTQEEVARGAAGRNGKGGTSRGSTNNARRLQAFAGRTARGSGDWGACDPKWIQAVVVAVTRLGGAVTFSLSRDGGAHGMTLLLDDERQTLWFNGDADLDAELEGAAAVLETL